MDNESVIEEINPSELAYIKRPDLRPEEVPDTTTCEDLDAWRYWIESSDLMEELKGKGYGDEESINAIAIVDTEIHGIPDPAKIIAFFCACHEWGVYPPAWIMNELYQRFNGYLVGNGTGKDRRHLGEYFGEPAQGKRGAYFRQQVFAPVIESMCISIDRLRYVFNLSIDDAVGIVATRIDDMVNNTGHNFDMGEEGLKEEYKNKWGKINSKSMKTVFDERPPTGEQNREFLRQFNEDALSAFPQLRAYLKN